MAQNVYIVEVVAVGKLVSNSNKPSVIQSLAKFNADAHAIKVRIPGVKFDGGPGAVNLAELPNCFPLMPKHVNLVPKVGEMVLVMTIGDNERFNDRFYIGPIVSTPTKLNKEPATTAIDNLNDGTFQATQNINAILTARGIYENKQNVVIEGRYNTDMIQRDGEILLRAGKFINNEPLKFNSRNPGYIQINSNFNIWVPATPSPSPLKSTNSYGDNIFDDNTGTSKRITVTNIVSDKINLLTYNGSPDFSGDEGLTKVKVNKDGSSVAEYIDDEKLAEILYGAHPLVFGDTLLEYLRLMKNCLLNHVHNGSGNVATDIIPGSTVHDLNKSAEKLEAAMLSKNIRIN